MNFSSLSSVSVHLQTFHFKTFRPPSFVPLLSIIQGWYILLVIHDFREGTVLHNVLRGNRIKAFFLPECFLLCPEWLSLLRGGTEGERSTVCLAWLGLFRAARARSRSQKGQLCQSRSAGSRTAESERARQKDRDGMRFARLYWA